MSAHLARWSDLPPRVEVHCRMGCVDWMVVASTSEALRTLFRHVEARHNVSAANA